MVFLPLCNTILLNGDRSCEFLFADRVGKGNLRCMIILYKIITSVFKETPSYEEATANYELPIKKGMGQEAEDSLY